MLAFHQIRLPLHVHLIVDKSYQMPIKFTLPETDLSRQETQNVMIPEMIVQ